MSIKGDTPGEGREGGRYGCKARIKVRNQGEVGEEHWMPERMSAAEREGQG